MLKVLLESSGIHNARSMSSTSIGCLKLVAPRITSASTLLCILAGFSVAVRSCQLIDFITVGVGTISGLIIFVVAPGFSNIVCFSPLITLSMKTLWLGYYWSDIRNVFASTPFSFPVLRVMLHLRVRVFTVAFYMSQFSTVPASRFIFIGCNLFNNSPCTLQDCLLAAELVPDLCSIVLQLHTPLHEPVSKLDWFHGPEVSPQTPGKQDGA